MTQIDQFESVFNAAAKDRYQPTPHPFERVLVVSDLDDEEVGPFIDSCKRYLSVVDKATWTHKRLIGDDDVEAFLSGLNEDGPDLIVTYRNLADRTFRFPYSLGVWLSLLMRKTNPPVLVMPHPLVAEDGSISDDNAYPWAGINTDRVMVVTDHLTGDNALVDFGVSFTEPKGKLYLTHVEDDAVFERYMGVIGKIPAIDTPLARERIQKQLLKEPADYIATVANALEGRELEVVETVTMGHQVEDYRRLVEEHNVDLLIFRTEDEGETLSMHGVAYSLAVELRKLPLLML